VDVDGKAGVRQAVEHLLSLGHHRIGLIAWSESSLSGYYRYQGYLQALENAHITPHPDWVIRGEHAEPSGREAMRTLLDLPPSRRPSAVVAVSDLMAIGAMNGIYEAGLQPGRDIAVIGFDDMPAAQYYRPPLTTVHQPIAEVGRRVIDMLLQIIRGEQPRERKVLLKPQLVVRASSGGAI
jgi:DNA-binding LacI/PurR family transcriptional regulator